MEAGQARLRAFSVSLRTFRLLSYVTLALLFAIVVSGATVRLTASGLGCENWPRCGDTFLPEKDFHALVEFGNRGVGFIVGLVSLATSIAAWRVERLPRWVVWAAAALPLTVLLQGVLGGITVLVELHPLTVMAHFLLSLVALAIAVVVVLGAHHPVDRPALRAPSAPAWLAAALVPSALVLVVTGALVTAAGPHSGGEDIRRIGDLDEALHVHIGSTAVFGVTFLALVIALILSAERFRTELAVAAGVLAVLLTQMVIGEVQWRTELPWWLVLVHVALATAVWAGVVALAARLLAGPGAGTPVDSEHRDASPHRSPA
jgi:cytochrome c oxidase assembly protein subunit 15